MRVLLRLDIADLIHKGIGLAQMVELVRFLLSYWEQS